MTPKKKTSNSTTLKMERKKIVAAKSDASSNVHVAGGTNTGIVVNKQQGQDQDDIWATIAAHLCLEFSVFLINTSTKRYTQEKRIISYWFKDLFPLNQRATAAQDFFKTLVSPADFPRDYVGFIKKVMKLMQRQYPMMAKVEVEMTQEKEMDQLPNRPSKYRFTIAPPGFNKYFLYESAKAGALLYHVEKMDLKSGSGHERGGMTNRIRFFAFYNNNTYWHNFAD